MKFSLREGSFPSATGLCDIRYRMWIPEKAHAAMQLTHGMAEHIDRYDEFASFLAENGVLVYGNDLASHGKSTRAGLPKGFFGEKDGWDAVVKDMRTLRSLVWPEFTGIPYILFGHSMGAILARTYAGRDGLDFDAFIFSAVAGASPILGIAKIVARFEIKKNGGKLPSMTLYNGTFGSYNKAFRPNRTACDWLSRDEAKVDEYAADENCGFPFTAHGMKDMFAGMTEISSKAWAKRVPNRPILIMSGAKDPVGNNGKGVKQVYNWLKKTGHAPELKLYEEARHEMLNEINRKEVYADILGFINSVKPAAESK